MKNSKEAYGANGRTNLLMFDPEKLVIVDDPKHPLYDERHKLPVSETMVLNIMHLGVLEPIIVRKNPETGLVEVIDGRQRVKNTREANKRFKARGEVTILVPAIVRRGEGAALAGVMVSTNEIREDDSPLNKAKKMARLLEMGKTEEDLALLFGIGKQSVGNYLSLLECTQAVKSAVETKKLPVSEAYKLAKLAPDEQKTTLEGMLAAAATGASPREKARKMREASGSGPQRRSKREIQVYRTKLEEKCVDEKHREIALSLLKWVLGGAEPRFPRAQKPVMETETQTTTLD